jgi:hypothetical protein
VLDGALEEYRKAYVDTSRPLTMYDVCDARNRARSLVPLRYDTIDGSARGRLKMLIYAHNLFADDDVEAVEALRSPTADWWLSEYRASGSGNVYFQWERLF